MTENQENKETWNDEQKWSFLVRHERLGELLVRQGRLSLGQLESALKDQESRPEKHLGEIIVEKKYLTLDEIIHALENQKKISQTSEQLINQLKNKQKE
ncbi:MAG: hypothetical protein K2X27_12190 [Candidatus Obscuribacterales bacterium]|nr:hypothetical protein [Candidatus Obscuribacterales bacterium]